MTDSTPTTEETSDVSETTKRSRIKPALKRALTWGLAGLGVFAVALIVTASNREETVFEDLLVEADDNGEDLELVEAEVIND